MKIEYAFYLPVKKDQDNNRINGMINELLTLSGLLSVYFEEPEVISPLYIENVNHECLPDNLKEEFQYCYCFKIYAIHSIFDKFTDETIPLKDLSDAMCLSNSYFLGVFERRIYDLIIAINIAWVGSLDADEGALYINNVFRKRTNKIWAELNWVYKFSEEKGWPILHKLCIKETWNWINSRNGYLHDLGGTPLDRALSAFSYLFHNNGNFIADMDIFWTMVGIEALYTNNSTAIKEQIISKCQVVLGNQVHYKKIFKGMYDLRSRLIHGDLNFPGNFFIHDGTKEFDTYFSKISDASLMAKAILIATFQQMIINDLEILEFSISLVD